MASESRRRHAIKCVVWDLDNTIWHGILSEDATVNLRAGVTDIIKTLDARGILHSIASRNDFAQAMAKLEDFGLREFFLYPQINWNSKAASLTTIAGSFGLGPDSFAFVDDDPFEREEIKFFHPEVLCLDAADLSRMAEMPALMPDTLTADAKMRRRLYLDSLAREQAEAEFVGPREEFLATLGMVFSIAPVRVEDLERAEELTVRTHQLNATGYTYSREELNQFRQSDSHRMLIASLRDRFGSYGRVGLALVECTERVWTLKLLLMSCRVASRGVGTILLNHIVEEARRRGVVLRAIFVPNDRNRMMYVTYKFAGFREKERRGGCLILEHDPKVKRPAPDYVEVRYFPDSAAAEFDR
jgi:FkbH-like protein